MRSWPVTTRRFRMRTNWTWTRAHGHVRFVVKSCGSPAQHILSQPRRVLRLQRHRLGRQQPKHRRQRVARTLHAVPWDRLHICRPEFRFGNLTNRPAFWTITLVGFLLAVLTANAAQLIPTNRTFNAAWQTTGYPGPIPAPAGLLGSLTAASQHSLSVSIACGSCRKFHNLARNFSSARASVGPTLF